MFPNFIRAVNLLSCQFQIKITPNYFHPYFLRLRSLQSISLEKKKLCRVHLKDNSYSGSS